MSSIIVHAGAWDIPDAEVAAHHDVVGRALVAGWAVLVAGGRAADAVEAAVVVLEDDHCTDAGTGSVLSAEGAVQLDAGMMRAADLAVGAVATVTRVANPIRLARRLLDDQLVLLTGAGAEAFAVRCGVPLVDNGDLIVDRERRRWERWRADGTSYGAGESCTVDGGSGPGRRVGPSDTVGAVALDAHGDLVAGVSTGGTPFAPTGRVGDVPIVGCGFHASAGRGAAVATGDGESISRVGLARTATDLLATGCDAETAARTSIGGLGERVGGRGGLILLDRHGRPGAAYNTGRMPHGWVAEDGVVTIGDGSGRLMV
jgi:beta-aspartyl-peptidase (threonine type)